MSSDAIRHSRVTIIGGGKMGEAMASGWVSSGVISPDSVKVVEPGDDRRSQVHASGLRVFADAADALPADVVVLAVKPQVIDEVVAALPPLEGALVVSIAAGVTTARLEGLLPEGTAVVRVMPNTPAMVGEGMAVVSAGRHATGEQTSRVVGMFDLLGRAVAADESLQNAATAISGSGPAYFALVVDALAESGERAGLDRNTALTLAVQTMKGTSVLLERSAMSPQELIDAVSSPGGTTVAALAELDDAGVRDAFDGAVKAALRRAEELGAGR